MWRVQHLQRSLLFKYNWRKKNLVMIVIRNHCCLLIFSFKILFILKCSSSILYNSFHSLEKDVVPVSCMVVQCLPWRFFLSQATQLNSYFFLLHPLFSNVVAIVDKIFSPIHSLFTTKLALPKCKHYLEMKNKL